MKILSNAPWWLVSAGLHAVVLLGAALIYIERAFAIETTDLPIVVRPPEPDRIPVDPIRDDAKHKGAKQNVEPDPNVDPNEKVIVFPGATFSNKNRSNDNDPLHDEMKGQSKDFLSGTPGEAGGPSGRDRSKTPGWVSNIGIGKGGGGAGRYGDRFGSNKDTCIRENGGDPDAEGAVQAALRWLARHQSADGGWSAAGR